MPRTIVALAALTALYGAAAWMLSLPPFKPAPTFYESVAANGQSYTCNAGAGPNIFIRFQEEGHVAVIRAGNQTLRLPYKTSDGTDDVYQSGPWRLTLDPEANLTGPGNLRFGNCY